jgi:hypothetical protein
MCEIIERWRARRDSPKSRVPEELWKQVVEVARVDGVWATSKALRFNYTDLQRRLAEAPSARTKAASIERVATEFVEIPATSVVARGADAKVVVELLGVRNERMRIEADPRALDVAALVRAFWSRAP